MNRTVFHEHIFPIRHKLFRFALRITGNSHEAEDVVQEVLEKVWKTSDDQAASVNNWEAWCMTLTRNRSLDRTRSRQIRRYKTLESASDRAEAAPSPAQNAELNDMAAQVRRFMNELPEKQRLVMHLRDVEELAYEEIAETLAISIDQVKVNLHRARKSVRMQLLALDKPTVFLK